MEIERLEQLVGHGDAHWWRCSSRRAHGSLPGCARYTARKPVCNEDVGSNAHGGKRGR
jgi:hypothetical protein